VEIHNYFEFSLDSDRLFNGPWAFLLSDAQDCKVSLEELLGSRKSKGDIEMGWQVQHLYIHYGIHSDGKR